MPTSDQSQARERYGLLTRLYAEQAAGGSTDYLREHARPATVAHHVNVFEWYAPYLEGRTAVLDWGCNHGPDACLLRHRFGDALDLHACDFIAETDFPAFRGAARARYAQITDPFRLPYPNDRFDAVVGSGVLEHTAMDGEALKEVYRVLRPGGLLVVTYLPYAYSWAEWRERRRGGGHRRLYTRRGMVALLKSHGFYPLVTGFHTHVPNTLGKDPRVLLGFGLGIRRRLQSFKPLVSHSTLRCVAQKMTAM